MTASVLLSDRSQSANPSMLFAMNCVFLLGSVVEGHLYTYLSCRRAITRQGSHLCFRASQLERRNPPWCNRINCTTRGRVTNSQPHVVQSTRLHHKRPRPSCCTTALAMKCTCHAVVQWRFQGQSWCNRADCATRWWLNSPHDTVVQSSRLHHADRHPFSWLARFPTHRAAMALWS